MSPYKPRESVFPQEPNNLLATFSYLLPQQGHSLDIACGNGQDSLFLARRGLKVMAVDRSHEALMRGRNYSTHSNLRVAFVQSDLAFFSVPPEAFCVIICFKYRDPALYAVLRAALQPGGLLFYETYTYEHRRFGTRPQNPDHLLQSRELLRAFGDWRVIFYREEWLSKGMASLVARKPLRVSVPL